MNKGMGIFLFAMGAMTGAGFAAYKIGKFALTHEPIKRGIYDFVRNSVEDAVFEKYEERRRERTTYKDYYEENKRR